MEKHTTPTIVLLLTVILGLIGWVGEGIHSQVQVNSQALQVNANRITTMESLLIDRTEALTRLAILERDIDELKSKLKSM